MSEKGKELWAPIVLSLCRKVTSCAPDAASKLRSFVRDNPKMVYGLIAAGAVGAAALVYKDPLSAAVRGEDPAVKLLQEQCKAIEKAAELMKVVGPAVYRNFMDGLVEIGRLNITTVNSVCGWGRSEYPALPDGRIPGPNDLDLRN